MDSRRIFIKKSAVLAIAITTNAIIKKATASTQFLGGKAWLNDNSKFTLLPLPYEYNALEPYIDKLTMEIHHSKHHQAYVNNLNKALEANKEDLLGSPPEMENIFNKMDRLPVAIRNNAGGHYNHSLFWTLICPATQSKESGPTGKLADAINKQFGTFEAFKKQFTEAGMKHFGSGWIWLIKTKEGKLAITATANQDNPLMNLPEIIKGEPVLALDVWEHAYYLKNENRRADYIVAWWNVVNWKAVGDLYEH